MVGEMLRGSAAIAAILSGYVEAQGYFLPGERMQDSACVLSYRAPPVPLRGNIPCCVPDRRAVPRLCPRA